MSLKNLLRKRQSSEDSEFRKKYDELLGANKETVRALKKAQRKIQRFNHSQIIKQRRSAEMELRLAKIKISEQEDDLTNSHNMIDDLHKKMTSLKSTSFVKPTKEAFEEIKEDLDILRYIEANSVGTAICQKLLQMVHNLVEDYKKLLTDQVDTKCNSFVCDQPCSNPETLSSNSSQVSTAGVGVQTSVRVRKRPANGKVRSSVKVDDNGDASKAKLVKVEAKTEAIVVPKVDKNAHLNDWIP